MNPTIRALVFVGEIGRFVAVYEISELPAKLIQQKK